jgi:hypothetical protein
MDESKNHGTIRTLSNEWSCRYVSTILSFLGNFCVGGGGGPVVPEVAKMES